METPIAVNPPREVAGTPQSVEDQKSRYPVSTNAPTIDASSSPLKPACQPLNVPPVHGGEARISLANTQTSGGSGNVQQSVRGARDLSPAMHFQNFLNSIPWPVKWLGLFFGARSIGTVMRESAHALLTPAATGKIVYPDAKWNNWLVKINTNCRSYGFNDYSGRLNALEGFEQNQTCEHVNYITVRDGAVPPVIKNGCYSTCPPDFHLVLTMIGQAEVGPSGGHQLHSPSPHYIRLNEGGEVEGKEIEPVWTQKHGRNFVPTDRDGSGKIMRCPDDSNHVYEMLFYTIRYRKCDYFCVPNKPDETKLPGRESFGKTAGRFVVSVGVFLGSLGGLRLDRRQAASDLRAPTPERDARLVNLSDDALKLAYFRAAAIRAGSPKHTSQIAKENNISGAKRLIKELRDANIIGDDPKLFADPTLVDILLADEAARQVSQS